MPMAVRIPLRTALFLLSSAYAPLGGRGFGSLAGLAALIAWILGAPPLAAGGKEITTPSGEKVVVEHVILHSTINSDFYEYRNSSGNTVRHGVFKRILPGGELLELTTYAHGVRHGRFVKWSRNRIKEVEGYYQAGHLDGEILWFHPSGRLRSRETFVDGELDGEYIWYHENGRVREKGAYRRGERHGPFVEFHESGEKYMEGVYRDGLLEGPVRIFDESGRLLGEGNLLADRIDGPWFCYDLEGKPGPTAMDCRGKVLLECACE